MVVCYCYGQMATLQLAGSLDGMNGEAIIEQPFKISHNPTTQTEKTFIHLTKEEIYTMYLVYLKFK